MQQPETMTITALDGSQPHRDWGGWQGFLEACCDLRAEVYGVRYFGSANCNYIVFPTGDLLKNFGYHGRVMMNRVGALGWTETLRLVKAGAIHG